MKPASLSRTIRCIGFVVGVLIPLTPLIQAQHIVDSPDNPQSQADYVIICPPSYVTIMRDFATHRSSFSNLRVAIVTTDAIYQVFGQGVRADSAIRDFVTYALTSWTDPKPQYFLLAGNVNVVPSHKEPGIESVGEDSVMVDQWFVEGVEDSVAYRRPAAAIGRFPGWDVPHMTILIWKTMQYDAAAGSAWRSRAISVADYNPYVGNLFELSARNLQSILSPQWTDTITVHVRPTSPLYRTPAQFRVLWGEGASIVTFIGLINQTVFSQDYYFTTSDIDSLTNGSPLSMVCFMGSQRFENRDTLCLAAELALIPDKGAICTLSPSGLAYFTDTEDFMERMANHLAANPDMPIGKIIFETKQEQGGYGRWSRETLLGDPAVVIKNPLLADVHGNPDVPRAFTLHQNFPNPFNPSTVISFDLPQSGVVSLTLFNLLGQEIGTLVNGFLGSGAHSVVLNADEFRLGSGVYFYRLASGNLVQTRKMILLR